MSAEVRRESHCIVCVRIHLRCILENLKLTVLKSVRMPEIYVDMLEAFPEFCQTTKAISKIRMKRAKSSR
jgi:hypothetical protein